MFWSKWFKPANDPLPFDGIFDSIPLGMAYLDINERYKYVNEYYQEHFNRKNVIGKSLLEVIGQKAYQKLSPYLKLAYKGQSVTFETHLNRGHFLSSIEVQIIISPHRSQKGKILGVIGVAKDISQRREIQRRLDFALQSGSMGTWEIDLQDKRISCSKEMLDLWSIDAERFKGEREVLQNKVHPDDLEEMQKQIEVAIKNRSIYECEYRILPLQGQMRWVLSRGRCTFDSSGKPIRFSGVVFDITERKAKEEDLSRALKLKEQFFMIASHELKTPLTCLQLQLNIGQWDLKNMYPEAFTQVRIEASLKKQQQHLDRITRLVDNILDESRISQGRLPIQKEKFDLTKMVSDVIEQFRVTAEDAATQITMLPSPQIVGYWDKFRLEQVLLNLLMNAVRYGNKKTIQVCTQFENGMAILIVRDQGIGIALADQTRVFERFEQVNPKSETAGMGLGLYISNHIIIAHSGHIRLSSELDKGSEFAIHLPLSN